MMRERFKLLVTTVTANFLALLATLYSVYVVTTGSFRVDLTAFQGDAILWFLLWLCFPTWGLSSGLCYFIVLATKPRRRGVALLASTLGCALIYAYVFSAVAARAA